MIWLQILATILVAIIDGLVDAKRWLKNQVIYHFVEFLARGIALFYISGWDWKVFILLIGVFWIPFELTLYKTRRMPWDFVGTSDFLDKLWQKLFPEDTGKKLMIVKVAVLIGCIVFYLIIN